MEWSTESIEKVICFVQERPFLFDVSSAELAWTCTKNLMQETCTRSCAIFLTVCHQHYSDLSLENAARLARADELRRIVESALALSGDVRPASLSSVTGWSISHVANRHTFWAVTSPLTPVNSSRHPSLSRYDSVLINRLQIGHTRLTNSYLLKGANQPECQICHSPLTVKHILIDCTCFNAARQRYLGVDTLKELFENVESQNIVAFIKDINFYHCI